MKKIYKEVNKIIPNIDIKFNANLKQCHTYHIECYANVLISVNNKKDLILLLEYLKDKGIDYFILGKGSNVIFKHKNVKTLIIRLCGNEIKALKNNYIECYAGLDFNSLISFCADKNLTGLEWATRIPASVGGGIAMNMGSFNHSISEFLREITYYDGEKIIKRKVKKQDFSYRNSIFKQRNFVIISAKFKLKQGSYEEIKAKIKKYAKIKALTQPIFEYSCGSVFKNGKEYYVAKLIQDCNLKGYSIGGAEISTLHSNFIINKNNATSNDIMKIIKYIKKVIQKQYNICIFLEVVVK